MKRFDKVMISQLKFGNTFYFPSDPKKTVWSVSEPNEGQYEGQKIQVTKLRSIEKKNVRPDVDVIFLRAQ
jgi:hypothetical protein